jgi:hypothetical protein
MNEKMAEIIHSEIWYLSQRNEINVTLSNSNNLGFNLSQSQSLDPFLH